MTSMMEFVPEEKAFLDRWSRLRSMTDCESIYHFAYVPFSGAVHNMWQHVSVYNLENCSKPLHKYHKVPVISHFDADLDYVYRSAKYVHRSYKAIDDQYGLEIEEKLPLEFFVDELSKLDDQVDENRS